MCSPHRFASLSLLCLHLQLYEENFQRSNQEPAAPEIQVPHPPPPKIHLLQHCHSLRTVCLQWLPEAPAPGCAWARGAPSCCRWKNGPVCCSPGPEGALCFRHARAHLASGFWILCWVWDTYWSCSCLAVRARGPRCHHYCRGIIQAGWGNPWGCQSGRGGRCREKCLWWSRVWSRSTAESWTHRGRRLPSSVQAPLLCRRLPPALLLCPDEWLGRPGGEPAGDWISVPVPVAAPGLARRGGVLLHWAPRRHLRVREEPPEPRRRPQNSQHQQ